MEYTDRGWEGLYINDETAVTLGKFDGLHRGHQKLIRRTREFARQGLKSVVFTLDFNRKGMLLTREERRAMLEKQGVDYLVECPFLPEVAHMEPEEFIRGILAEKLHAREVIVGADFHFGYERKGDAHLLMELQKIYGYEAEIIKKETYNGREISSTYIREALGKGEMELAKRPSRLSVFCLRRSASRKTYGRAAPFSHDESHPDDEKTSASERRLRFQNPSGGWKDLRRHDEHRLQAHGGRKVPGRGDLSLRCGRGSLRSGYPGGTASFYPPRAEV